MLWGILYILIGLMLVSYFKRAKMINLPKPIILTYIIAIVYSPIAFVYQFFKMLLK